MSTATTPEPISVPEFNDTATPEARVDRLREHFAAAKPGDVLAVKPGLYRSAKFPKIPDGVKIIGAGRGRTIFQSPDYYELDEATAFDLGDDSWVEKITFQSIAPKNRQSITIGFLKAADPTKVRPATIFDCEVLDGVWGIYNWQPSVRLKVERTYVRAARIGICAGASGGPTAQIFELLNNKIDLDHTLSTQGGSVTHPQWGGQVAVLCRGGVTTIDGLDVMASGVPQGTGPRVAAVSDWLDLDTSPSTVIAVSRLRTRLHLLGAVERYDTDVRYGTLRLGGSYGSGKNGALVIGNEPPLVKATG